MSKIRRAEEVEEPLAFPAMPARNSKRSAAIVGLAVMGSRFMGVIREQVFAFMFGASKLSDVFIAAFRIPNLAARSFCGRRAFDRVHHHVHEDMGEGRARRVLASCAARALHADPHPWA